MISMAITRGSRMKRMQRSQSRRRRRFEITKVQRHKIIRIHDLSTFLVELSQQLEHGNGSMFGGNCQELSCSIKNGDQSNVSERAHFELPP